MIHEARILPAARHLTPETLMPAWIRFSEALQATLPPKPRI
jgi:hypothetical protein